MLEKMGWSKGKGLGAKEQGSTEHVKVHLKNNTLGLGATVNHEDNWLAHQDDFNQILAQLNNCHGQNETDSLANEEKKTFSLEEKSKTSKKRVHYMKFAKGKDLSSRSDTDLACIFGKRSKSKKKAEVDTSIDSQGEDEKPEKINPLVVENTVTSTLSVSEYFAKRMAQLKKPQTIEDAEPVEDVPETTIRTQSSEEPSLKSKKKKKRKRNAEEKDECPEEPVFKHKKNKDLVDNLALEEPIEENHIEKKKKKRKDKRRKREAQIEAASESEEITLEEPECDFKETQMEQKKKKKTKKSKH